MNRIDNVTAEERRRIIVELVNRRNNLTVSYLCSYFNVSSATIRNDLRELEMVGSLRRTHGGAVSVNNYRFDLPYIDRLVEHNEEKQAIGQYAVNFVKPGDKIAIDTGTTTRELALSLTQIENITVVTNDLEVAYYLNNHSKANVFLTGGFLRKGFNSISGDVAINTLKNVYIDKAFISAEGITIDKGITTTDINLAIEKTEFIKRASQTILLSDGSKFGRVAFSKFADISDIDTIITTNIDDENIIKEYNDHFVEVININY